MGLGKPLAYAKKIADTLARKLAKCFFSESVAPSVYLISTFEAEGITDIAEFEAHGQTIADFEANGWTG